MNAHTIRIATSLDLDAIWAIEDAVFGAEAWSKTLMREELTAPHREYVVLIDEHGKIRGYGGLLAVGTEGDVQTIALDPAVRGLGYGRRLMGVLLDAAALNSVQNVFLEVRADNPVAQNLYSSLGFSQIAVRPKYYQPDGVDALVMQLNMKDRR